MKHDWGKIIHETYVALFAASEPPVDFDKLVQEAKDLNNRDDEGRLIIQFLNYTIDEKLMDEIVAGIIEKYKIKNYYAQQFKNTIYLGCSPAFKKNK